MDCAYAYQYEKKTENMTTFQHQILSFGTQNLSW